MNLFETIEIFRTWERTFPSTFFLSESCTTIFDFSFHFSSVSTSHFFVLIENQEKKLFPSHVCQIPNFVSIYFLSEVYCKDNRFFFCQNLPSFSPFSFSIPEIKRRSDHPSPSPSNSNRNIGEEIKGIESNLPI